MRSLRKAIKLFGALAGLVLLWWVYRAVDDPVGEMACDMDDFDYDDDDPGVDVDDD